VVKGLLDSCVVPDPVDRKQLLVTPKCSVVIKGVNFHKIRILGFSCLMLAQEGAAGVEPKPAFNISAGLTLTTQLLSLIAFFTSGTRDFKRCHLTGFSLFLIQQSSPFLDKFHLRKARNRKRTRLVIFIFKIWQKMSRSRTATLLVSTREQLKTLFS